MSGRKVDDTGEAQAFVSGQTMCRVVTAGQPPRDITLDELIDAYGGDSNFISPGKRESLRRALKRRPVKRLDRRS
jgi:hypothetical protein